MKKSLCAGLTALLISPSSFAKPADADLVVPVGNAQSDLAIPDPKFRAQDDAIQVQRLKADEVSDDAAQNRRPPPKDRYNHLVAKPDFNYDPENAQLKSKVKSSKPPVRKSTKYGSIHVGPYYPDSLVNGTNPQITYANVYGANSVPMIQGDIEWYLLRTVGKLGVKAGLGFFTAQGDGRFLNEPTIRSVETLNLFVLPLTAAGVYHLQFWDKQILVPYGEGGIDYFGIFEIRSDALAITEGHYGGALAAHYAAGLQLQLDFLDKAGLWHMHQEYGINHLYFIAGIRQFIGLSDTYDFSAFMYEGGFSFEF